MSDRSSEEVCKISTHLASHFWEEFKHSTLSLPDTHEGNIICLAGCEASICSIVIEYLLGFPSSDRRDMLDQMVKNFHDIERATRNIEISYEE